MNRTSRSMLVAVLTTLVLLLATSNVRAQVDASVVDAGASNDDASVGSSLDASTSPVDATAPSDAGPTTPSDAGGTQKPSCPIPEEELADACREHCEGSNTICFRVDTAEQVCGSPPESVGAGQTLILRVIGPEGCSADVEIGTSTVRSRERLFRDPSKTERLLAIRIVVLKELSVDVSDDVKFTAVKVEVSSNAADAPGSLVIPIDHGRYYADLGVMAAFMPQGSREIVRTPVPGVAERRLSIEEDWSIRPAIVLNLYPFGGRDRGAICPMCESRPLQNLISAQLGIDYDVSDLGRGFFGGFALEPISGISVGGGLALVRGEFLPDGFEEGMLVTSNFEPREQRVLRAYFGVTLSLEVLTTIGQFSKQVRGISYQ